MKRREIFDLALPFMIAMRIIEILIAIVIPSSYAFQLFGGGHSMPEMDHVNVETGQVDQSTQFLIELDL